MGGPFIPVRKQPVRKGGGPLVPDNLYRLLNRYECPSGTGTDERFSTSDSSGLVVYKGSMQEIKMQLKVN